MASFVFTETGPQFGDSTCFGTAAGQSTDTDIGKIVKLGALGHNHVLATSGDEIEGFVMTVEPFTRNDGFSFGTVERVTSGYRKVVDVAAAQVGTVDPGDLVVAGTQIALGTAGNPKVITGTPTKYLWRCIRIITGTGAAGDSVLIERI